MKAAPFQQATKRLQYNKHENTIETRAPTNRSDTGARARIHAARPTRENLRLNSKVSIIVHTNND